MRPGAGRKVEFPLLNEKTDPLPGGWSRGLYELGRGTRWLELITVERISILEGVCTQTRSLETPNGSLCYKGSVHGVSGIDRCDSDDSQGRMNLSVTLKLTDYECRLSASRHPGPQSRTDLLRRGRHSLSDGIRMLLRR